MRNIGPGKAFPRGATFDGSGVNFAVFSRVADARRGLPLRSGRPEPGERAVRAARTDRRRLARLRAGPCRRARSTACACTGPTRPSRATAAIRASCWSIPTRKAIWGEVDWKQPVLGYQSGDERADLSIDQRDSAAGAPKGVVDRRSVRLGRAIALRSTPWRKTIIYEVHVRGFTKLHPEVPEELRGTYAGLGAPGGDRAPEEPRRDRRRAPARARVRRRRVPRGQVAAQLLGLQHARLLRARAALRERAAGPAGRSPSSRRWSRRCTRPGSR